MTEAHYEEAADFLAVAKKGGACLRCPLRLGFQVDWPDPEQGISVPWRAKRDHPACARVRVFCAACRTCPGEPGQFPVKVSRSGDFTNCRRYRAAQTNRSPTATDRPVEQRAAA